jgi:hypothetical protein
MRFKINERKILQAGLLVGTLDITAASIQYIITTQKNPVRILWYIASAVFGKEAYNLHPALMAVCGLLFHYLIAITFTVLFFLIYPTIISFAKNRVLTGIVYGLFVWSVMNLVVVPFSRITTSPVKFPQSFIQMGILIVCIGLPLSFMAHRYFNKRMQLQEA